MPTYGYRCEKNGHEFEVVQGINEPPLTRCRICGSNVRRIFYPVGIVFKGPGFYKTDSRSKATIAASEKDNKPPAEKDGAGTGEKDGAGTGEKATTAKKAEPKKSKGDAKTKKSA